MDVIDDIVEYETTPGVIILVLRVLVMLTFLASLRDTMLRESNSDRLSFFLHFGAASLVWFMYLPAAAFVAHRISALWRIKFLNCVVYSADTFAYAVIIHLLWPSRSEQYFLLAAPNDPALELEDELFQSATSLVKTDNCREDENEQHSTVSSNLVQIN